MITSTTIERARQALGDSAQKSNVAALAYGAKALGDLINQRAEMIAKIVTKEKQNAAYGVDQSRVEETRARNALEDGDKRIALIHQQLVDGYEQLLPYGVEKADYGMSLPAIPPVPKSQGPISIDQAVKATGTAAGATAQAPSAKVIATPKAALGERVITKAGITMFSIGDRP